MSSNVNIKYVNHSMNLDQPSVFVFTKNEIPSFDALREGVAWRVINKVGRGSSCNFTFPISTEISASWNDGCCRTAMLPAVIGSRFCVAKDSTGIVLRSDGNASSTTSIDVCSDIQTPGGVSVSLYKDGRVVMTKQVVSYNQKATFVLHPKLYWGLASEIQEGDQLSSAVLNSDSFFEQDLEGVSEVTVGLYGNAEDGYSFKIDDWK